MSVEIPSWRSHARLGRVTSIYVIPVHISQSWAAASRKRSVLGHWPRIRKVAGDIILLPLGMLGGGSSLLKADSVSA